MAFEENGFLEYLSLQGGEPDLVTKSDLRAAVKERGQSVSDRQLTFYMSEGLIPKSVRVGSRAGVYPKIVVDLLGWILQARDGGVPIEAIKELIPVWKFMYQARKAHRLDLGELEYVARQHVASTEGSLAVPLVVTEMMDPVCNDCRKTFTVTTKDGREVDLGNDQPFSVGFSIARKYTDDDGEPQTRWFARTRVTLADVYNQADDPTTVILGVKPNEEVPGSTPKSVSTPGRDSQHPGEVK